MHTEPAPVSGAQENSVWGPDWPAVREQWPLEYTVAHLNHGSMGAVPTPVLDEQASWRDRMEINPVRFFTRELGPGLDEARAEATAFLGLPADAAVLRGAQPRPRPRGAAHHRAGARSRQVRAAARSESPDAAGPVA